MHWPEAIAGILGALGIFGFAWRAVSWHNSLVAKIDAAAADAKSQHEIQSGQIGSIQRELTEFKSECRRNFKDIYDRLGGVEKGLARLEGKSED